MREGGEAGEGGEGRGGRKGRGGKYKVRGERGEGTNLYTSWGQLACRRCRILRLPVICILAPSRNSEILKMNDK